MDRKSVFKIMALPMFLISLSGCFVVNDASGTLPQGSATESSIAPEHKIPDAVDPLPEPAPAETSTPSLNSPHRRTAMDMRPSVQASPALRKILSASATLRATLQTCAGTVCNITGVSAAVFTLGDGDRVSATAKLTSSSPTQWVKVELLIYPGTTDAAGADSIDVLDPLAGLEDRIAAQGTCQSLDGATSCAVSLDLTHVESPRQYILRVNLSSGGTRQMNFTASK